MALILQGKDREWQTGLLNNTHLCCPQETYLTVSEVHSKQKAGKMIVHVNGILK